MQNVPNLFGNLIDFYDRCDKCGRRIPKVRCFPSLLSYLCNRCANEKIKKWEEEWKQRQEKESK